MIDKTKLKELTDEARKISDEMYDEITDVNSTESTKFSVIGYKISELDAKLAEIADLDEEEQK